MPQACVLVMHLRCSSMGLLEYNSISYMDDEELFSCIAPLQVGLF